MVAATYAAAAGALVLIGWLADVRALTDWRGDGISTFPNTAIAVLLASAAVVLTAGGAGRTTAARILGVLAAAIAGLTLLEHVTGVDLGIDTLLVERPWDNAAAAAPMRMGPPASTALLLTGIATVLATFGSRARRASAALGVVTMAIAALSLTGYLYGAEQMYTLPRLTGIALPTSTMVFALGLATVLTVAEHEPMRTVLQRGAAGMLARRTLPVVVLLPLVVGHMRVGLQQGGFVDTAFGTALRSLVEIFLLTGLLWGAARLVRAHEEALRDSEAAERDTAVQRNLLAAIVQTSEDAIVSKTLDGIVTSWNDGARQLFGYPADEMIGSSITRIMPPERVDDLRRIIAKVRAGERIEHFETERIRKDGRRIPVSLTVSPIRDASGRIVGASKIARDITERRRAERELHETLDVLSTLNRTAILLSAELDLTKLVQTVTDAATEAIGARYGAFFYNVESPDGGVYSLYTLSGAPYSAFDRLGMPRATALFGPTFRGEAVIRLDDVRDDPRYGRSEPHFGMPPGHLPVVSYLAVPVVLRGEVLGGLFFAHPEPGRFSDRDERFVVGLAAQTAIAMENARLYHAERRSRAEAEAANRAKDELLSVVSHELRTPLAGMLGWTDLLRRGRVPAERQGAILDAIARGGRLQARLIDDLLDVSRLVSGRLTLVPEPIDLRAVLEATLEAIRPEAVSQDVEIASRCASGIRVSGDPARLQQVLANVLGNALKYTPSGRSIHVDVAHADGRAIVTVRDQGEGIEPELLPHVFEPFRQGSDIRKRTGGGLGLGLTIVKRIIEQHGGEVTIHSDGLHRGTVVRITLPVLQERESERDHSGPDALRESSSDA